MITIESKKTINRFGSSDGKEFEVRSVYCPTGADDKWVEYFNTKTGQEYSCRLEAFLSRFSPICN